MKEPRHKVNIRFPKPVARALGMAAHRDGHSINDQAVRYIKAALVADGIMVVESTPIVPVVVVE